MGKIMATLDELKTWADYYDDGSEQMKMKKYYTTMSPDAARHILLETEAEAVREATARVNEDGRPRYICKILYKVEPDIPPIKLTRIE